jgi:hypothetical protein
MKIKDWFKVKKEKRAAKKMAKVERKLVEEPEEFEQLGADTAGLEQPETRFTEEYREFLEKEEERRRLLELRKQQEIVKDMEDFQEDDAGE